MTIECKQTANTTTIESQATLNRDDIRRTFELFSVPDGVIELRAKNVEHWPRGKRGLWFSYYDDVDRFVDDAAKMNGMDSECCWFNINPALPNCLAISNNQIETSSTGDSADDGKIVRRQTLMIDFDPVREPAGISATDEEKKAALDLSRVVYADLKALGWPEPIVADSGNGYHLHYRIGLPVEDGGLVERCLHAFAEKYEINGVVGVDAGNHNAARMCKVYGTMARKKANTKERPHRLSTVLRVPDSWDVVPIELLEALGGEPPQIKPASNSGTTNGHAKGGIPAYDVEERMIRPHFPDTPPSHLKGDRRIWKLRVCPLNPDHCDDDAVITQEADGKVGAMCQHQTCDLNWEWLRAHYDPKPEYTAASRTHVTGRPHKRSLTDCGNSDRFVDLFGTQFRYVHAWKRWVRWTDTHWAIDDAGSALAAAKHTVRNIFSEVAGEVDQEKQKKIICWAQRSQQRERLVAGLALACPDLAIAPGELDVDRHLLNVLNGTIDLRTGKLCVHDPADFITKKSPVECDPVAPCPRFRKFLVEIFGQKVALIAYVQTLLGHCLTGEITEQILPVCHGTGANGKSVLLDVVRRVMGDYADFAPPGLLMLKRRDEHPTEIAGLAGKRLIISTETGKGGRLNLDLVKQLTGESEMVARFMRGDFFTFPRTFKTVLQTNNRPKVDEDSEAAWRRLRLVPFDITIPEAERDLKLIDKLMTEGPGILAWLVAGSVEWYRNGLSDAPEVRAATEEYRGQSDQLAPFIEDCAELSADGCTLTSALRTRYADWAKSSGERGMNRTDFADALRRHKCEPDRVQGARVWRGIRLNPVIEKDLWESGG